MCLEQSSASIGFQSAAARICFSVQLPGRQLVCCGSSMLCYCRCRNKLLRRHIPRPHVTGRRLDCRPVQIALAPAASAAVMVCNASPCQGRAATAAPVFGSSPPRHKPADRSLDRACISGANRFCNHPAVLVCGKEAAAARALVLCHKPAARSLTRACSSGAHSSATVRSSSFHSSLYSKSICGWSA